MAPHSLKEILDQTNQMPRKTRNLAPETAAPKTILKQTQTLEAAPVGKKLQKPSTKESPSVPLNFEVSGAVKESAMVADDTIDLVLNNFNQL